MKIVTVYFSVGLTFLGASSCFGQQPNQFVFIEGTVKKADGAPVAGASVSFSNGATFLTSGLGHYFNVMPAGFTGSVTASRSGYSYGFLPSPRSYTALSGDQVKQDFTGQSYVASGVVQARFAGASGVGLYFSGLGQGTASGGDGSYSLTIPDGYSGTTTPLSTSLTFTPSSSGSFGGDFTVTGITDGAMAYGSPAPWFLSGSSGVNCAADGFRSTYIFPPTTSGIHVYLATYPGDSFSFLWYDPSGIIRHQTPTSQLGGCGEATSLAVAGTDVVQYPGLWHCGFPVSPIKWIDSLCYSFNQPSARSTLFWLHGALSIRRWLGIHD